MTVCLSVRIIFFEWEGKTGRGDDPCLFSFIAVASVDNIYLRAGRVRLRGWGVKANFIFLPWGGCGSEGFKTNLNKK